LMKKFTIITLPEHENNILMSLGRAGITQLLEATGPDYERLREVAKEVDFEELKGKAEKELEDAETELEEAKAKLVEAKGKIACLRALEPDEFKRCLVVGVVPPTLLPGLEEHLNRLGDVTYRTVEISPEERFLFVFGPDERRRWVETIFLVFDVKDIFDVLDAVDVLLVLDPEKREETIIQYDEEIEKYDEEIKKLQNFIEIELEPPLRTLESLRRAPVLRTEMMSVIQGWVPTDKLPEFKEIIGDVEEEIGVGLIVQYEDPSHGEEVPTRRPTIRPKFFDPAVTLTTLRGWPTAHELNPSMVTLLIFSLQFGMMFGDVGQGLTFLVLGLILSRKFKRGLASKLGVAFVPMGIFSIFFGFLYGEVFLVEGIIHPILFSPLHSIMRLFQMVLGIAVLEMSVGLALGAINEYKEGNIVGVIGEHGAGGILFFVGLYFMATEFYISMDFMAIMGHWSFIVLMIGLLMAFVEPILSAMVMHKEISFEVVMEGMAALLITFIEGLANFFSFLRIAAFALAHASLAVAAHSMTDFMGVGGIVLMNVIAMSFEFISSSVQALRLLYYEFMGKFFQGTGSPFKPFRVRRVQK
jgi:V/A-type H+-transporting ATPase subunit I